MTYTVGISTTMIPMCLVPRLSSKDHGTVVAGVAAARIDNGVGSAGVAGTSPILPLRINDGKKASARAFSNAIIYAYQMSLTDPIDHLVINISQNLDKYFGS